MPTIIIVSAEKLPKAPEAFKQYVWEWFSEMTILGQKCWVAATHICTPDMGYRKGNAPRHSLELGRYQDGLKKGQGLNDWMREAEGTYLWSIEAAGEVHYGGDD